MMSAMRSIHAASGAVDCTPAAELREGGKVARFTLLLTPGTLFSLVGEPARFDLLLRVLRSYRAAADSARDGIGRGRDGRLGGCGPASQRACSERASM
jgi:hypothetical protein